MSTFGPRARLGLAAAVLVVAFIAIYLPSAGHGFVKDDFGWVKRSRIESTADVGRLFVTAPSGFYRPLVSLSFTLNAQVCGLEPRCYGATNVALALACAAAVFMLARAFSLSAGAALVAAALWAFNWHGINMATLWISGRTALLLVLFAVLAGAAFVRGRTWPAVAWLALAMLSKEEALLLPAVLVGWLCIRWLRTRQRDDRRRLLVFTALSAALIILYVVLRLPSGAFTPSSAPAYYRLALTPSRVAANLPAYFDRSATLALAILIGWLAFTRPPHRSWLPSADVALFAGLWWIGTLAVTVFLPVRSSLYACLPSVASALLVAAVVDRSAGAVPDRRVLVTAMAGMALPFALWPVYAARNAGSVGEADLSAATIRALGDVAAARGAGTAVLLRDDRSRRPSLDNAFGTLAQEAADLMVRPPVIVWIDPPPGDAALAGMTKPDRFDVMLVLNGGSFTARAPSP